MNLWQKLLAVAALVGAVVFLVETKNRKGDACCAGGVCALPPSDTAAVSAPVEADARAALPRLVDLGAGKCIPCKMMKPILDELAANYADRFETVFIDVWENEGVGAEYGIRIIPTQIFFDAEGKELFRHEGYMSKEDILAKWQELGYALAGEPQNSEQGMTNIEGD